MHPLDEGFDLMRPGLLAGMALQLLLMAPRQGCLYYERDLQVLPNDAGIAEVTRCKIVWCCEQSLLAIASLLTGMLQGCLRPS